MLVPCPKCGSDCELDPYENLMEGKPILCPACAGLQESEQLANMSQMFVDIVNNSSKQELRDLILLNVYGILCMQSKTMTADKTVPYSEPILSLIANKLLREGS